MDSFSVEHHRRSSCHCLGCNPCQRVCVEATLHWCTRWCDARKEAWRHSSTHVTNVEFEPRAFAQRKYAWLCMLAQQYINTLCIFTHPVMPCVTRSVEDCLPAVSNKAGQLFHSHTCEPSVGFPRSSVVKSLIQGRNSTIFVSDIVHKLGIWTAKYSNCSSG